MTAFGISQRALQLKESETLAMAKRARELSAQGKDIINLSLGEPDFFTPNFIKEAAKKAIDDNYSFYSPVSGFLDLRQAIVHKLKRDNHLNFEPAQIVVSTGAKQSIANMVLALVNPGDVVLIVGPYWVSYKEVVEFAGGKVIELLGKSDQQYFVQLADLKDALKLHRPKLIIFSNPSNPTGATYSATQLSQWAGLLVPYFQQQAQAGQPSYFLSDEIYEYIYFDEKPVSIASFPGMQEHCIVINGLSKGFAMTGWRLGYAAAPLALAQASEKIQGQFTSGTCAITQRAALAALAVDGDHPEIRQMRAAFKLRRDLLHRELSTEVLLQVPLPQGAFYLFIDVTKWLKKLLKMNGEAEHLPHELAVINIQKLATSLLDQYGLALTPGHAFGMPTCLRFSYALKEEKLLQACERMKRALRELVL